MLPFGLLLCCLYLLVDFDELLMMYRDDCFWVVYWLFGVLFLFVWFCYLVTLIVCGCLCCLLCLLLVGFGLWLVILCLIFTVCGRYLALYLIV